MTKHLTIEQLFAIYQGQAEESAALEHLASCAQCQKAFDESGWVRVLQRAAEPPDAGGHLGLDELSAFRHSALPSPRVAEIERHLRSCSRCLALYQRSRAEAESRKYLSPRPAQIRMAQRAFRPGKLRGLGTVLVTGLEKGPRLILLPDKRVASGPALFAASSLHSGGGAHPASAGQRAARLRRAEPAPEAFAAPARQCTTAATRGEPLRIRAGEWEIVIRAPSEKVTDRLELRLVSVAGEHPASDVRVSLRDPKGEQTEVKTDESGHARLPVVPGRSRVVVDVDPPLVFGLLLLD